MKYFCIKKLIEAGCYLSAFFQWCISCYLLLKKTRSTFFTACLSVFLGALILLGMAYPAQGAEKFCSDPPYYGVIDGSRLPAPTQITIDQDCTFKNFPQSKPLTTTINFHTNDPTIYLIIFDNVYFSGHMACANVDHRIWFSNSSDYGSSNACQDLFIPVESIDKQIPAGQTTASIGVPFTYTLTLPSMNLGGGPSANDLHSITFWDDLTAVGADLTYVDINAHYIGTNIEVPLIPEDNPDAPGGVWTPKNLSYKKIPLIRAGEQIVVEITVVLDDTSRNAPGTQFINTAKWYFGRLIDDVYYEPLPGEWGISQPMTIVGPELVVTKTGPASVINLGEWAEFTIDAWNRGIWAGEAWNVNIVDRLPNEPSNPFNGGMCDLTPEVTGVTLAGRSLTQDTDYLFSYVSCELSFTLLDPAGSIGPDEHLVISYRTKVDADSESGAILTNVAGATSWSNDLDDNTGQTYTCTLTNGTENTPDCQDAHDLLVVLSGYFFEKTAANPVTGELVTSALAGEWLRYTLRLRSINAPLSDIGFYDDLGVLNSLPAFEPGSLTLVNYPPGADISQTNPSGGTNNGGILDIRNLSVPQAGTIEVIFDIRLSPSLPEEFEVLNQAELMNKDGIMIALSDDPNISGQADPAVDGDEDKTRVVIYFPQPPPPLKETLSTTATIGEEVTYRITVPGELSSRPFYDVVINDVLDDNLEYLGFTQVSGPTVTDNSNAPDLNFSVAEIPASQQVVIQVRVRVENVIEAQQGIVVNNVATYTYANSPSGTTRPPLASGTATFNIIEPHITEITKSANPVTPNVGQIVRYSISLTASDSTYSADVFDVTIIDSLGLGLVYAGNPAVTLGTGDGADNTIGMPIITGDGSSTPQILVWSLNDGNADIDIAAGTSVTISYDVRVLDSVSANQMLTNSAVAQWTSIDGLNNYERNGTDGIGELNDYVTAAATETVTTRDINATMTVENLTTGQSGANASPGDRLRYTINIENTSDIPLSNFSLVDDVDELNSSPMFQPGLIENVSIPVGADYAINGSRLTIDNLNIGAYETLIASFEVVLVPVITSGTIVLNQGQLTLSGVVFARTDDPNVSGAENPTETLITSAPLFEVHKTSTIMEGDPDILMAGETLQYTITIKNIGNEDAVNVSLRDFTPAHTTYVANSTTLNGIAVSDPDPGVNPLHAGIQINTPDAPKAGDMRADATPGAANVATITFSVVVNLDAMDGLIIENQGFLTGSGAGSGPQPEQPSDDPNTPVPDDPTRNIIGNLPLLYAHKTVQKVITDPGQSSIVSPGDTLRYTIVINNSGGIPATEVMLVDEVPANTTYVENTLLLNGVSTGPDGGISPLIGGLTVNSSDNPGSGIISPGESATIIFEVRVNDGVPTGTSIVNQGTLTSKELEPDLTDGDSIPSNGRQPTVIVVGDVQLLSVTKEVLIVGSGIAGAGSELEYVIRATNIGNLPATHVAITDDLNPPLGDQVTYVTGSGTLNGLTAGIDYAGALLTADYAGQYGNLQPGTSAIVRFRVLINPALAIGTTITNTGVVHWNDPAQTATASVSLDVGGTPGSASLNGNVWHDASLDRVMDIGTETLLENWSVELYRNNQLVSTVLTDADGAYHLNSLVPTGTASDLYELRFVAPGAGPNTAVMGNGDSPFTNGPQRISDIIASSGANLQNLNLPLWPNGVVYNSVLRSTIAGARVALINAETGAALPGQCFDDQVQQNQITAADGFYKFDLNFSDPSCPAGGTYFIEVTPPAVGYMNTPSQIIALPQSNNIATPFPVPDCPGNLLYDAVPVTSDFCEAAASATEPPQSVPPDDITYYLYLQLSDGAMPGQSQIFNNFIPVDPELNGSVAITKTASMADVSRGTLVPYTITVTNVFGAPIYDISIVDRFPPGFKYVAGSARMDGNPLEPLINGQELIWNNLELQFNQKYTIQLLLVVGSGVSEGEYVNRAQVLISATGRAISEEATATVQVIPDPDFDCTDVIGKVFDDGNLNGWQDSGEHGLSGVRLVTARGLIATSDEHGRFHITCAVVPDEDLGSNFILKLDERSLPSGYRLTTENPRVQRATRGKMLRFNFGATIHRVVRIDIADGVFEPNSTQLRPQWLPKIDQLLKEMRKKPSILRLSYLGDVEGKGLVQDRLEMMKEEIKREWKQSDGGYQLVIETEIFWRRGAPTGR